MDNINYSIETDINEKEVETINEIEKNNYKKRNNPDIFRIELNKDLKAKLIFLAVKQNIKTNKGELEKLLQKLVIEKLKEEFKKETEKEENE